MSLLVVSYPDLPPHAAEWLRNLRVRFTGLSHSALDPHFTLVFPLAEVSQADLVEHVRTQLTGRPRIRFVLRSSLLVKDDASDLWYVLLVPDEGFGDLVKLHDTLYTGMLAPALRLDIPYIPHITVGYAADLWLCKRVVDQLNAENLMVSGVIDSLHVVRKEEGAALTVAQLPLS